MLLVHPEVPLSHQSYSLLYACDQFHVLSTPFYLFLQLGNLAIIMDHILGILCKFHTAVNKCCLGFHKVAVKKREELLMSAQSMNILYTHCDRKKPCPHPTQLSFNNHCCSTEGNYRIYIAGNFRGVQFSRGPIFAERRPSKILRSNFYGWPYQTGVFFFWTHFRLSLWTAMHMRMRSATPPVYLDL